MGCSQDKGKSDDYERLELTPKNAPQFDNAQYFKLKIPLREEYDFYEALLDDLEHREVKLTLKSNDRIERVGLKIPIPVDKLKHDELILKLRMMLMVDHPFIQKQVAVHRHCNYYILVREHVEGRTLLEYIKFNEYKESVIQQAIEDTLQALNYLHKRNICHGSLSTENIIFKGKIQNVSLCLMDYDFQDGYRHLELASGKKICSEYYYRCPESFRGEVTPKSDVWSMGVIIYQLMTGVKPFDGIDKRKLRNCIIRGVAEFETPEWEHINPECKALVEKMLAYIPTNRPDVQTCLKSTWLKHKSHKISTREKNRLARRLVQMSTIHYENKLQHAVMMLLIEQNQSQRQTKKLIKVFNKMDTDKSGSLSREELLNGLTAIIGAEAAQREIDTIFEQGDFDGQGEIDVNEFVTLFGRRKKMASKKRVMKLFQSVDLDGNGSLDYFEVRQLLLRVNLSEEQFTELMKNFDRDNDGQVSQEEFVDAIIAIAHQDQDKTRDQQKIDPGESEKQRLTRSHTHKHHHHHHKNKEKKVENQKEGTKARNNTPNVRTKTMK